MSDHLIVSRIESLNDEDFLFYSLVGDERLSTIYEFEVSLLSPRNDFDLKKLLGKSLTLEIRDKVMTPRYLNGKIVRMSLSGREESGNRYYIYRAIVRPSLWYSTQTSDCRIFQEKTVPEIITEVLSEYQIDLENRLIENYRSWIYCVQYQETDFDFVSRLMEHEGIYYYFIHKNGAHTMVLADAPQAHEILPGYDELTYRLSEGGLVDDEATIQSWEVSESITSSQFSYDDYDFRKPRARLLDTRQNPVSNAKDKAELFEWPGSYTDLEHGQFYTRVRQQELEANYELMQGMGSSLGLAPGYKFKMTDAPRREDDREYMTISTHYFFRNNRYSTSESDTTEHVTDFVVLPATTTWRPPRVTPLPKTNGPQTAEVAGPEGETIWTDEYGRVKLKFRWDRYCRGDETSSCWIRVSSGWWAGWRYGAVQIPRIGEEVIVDFVNGDPDRPIITGRVYNEDNMPPWELPAQKTKMGIVSRTPGMGPDKANFFCLDDNPGNERFDMHAEKDMNISVENNRDTLVQNNCSTRVQNSQTLVVQNFKTAHVWNSYIIKVGLI